MVTRPDAPLPASARAFVIDDEATPGSRRPPSERRPSMPPPSRPAALSMRGPDAELPPPPPPKVRPAAWVVLAMLAVPLAIVVAVIAWLPTWRPRETSAAAASPSAAPAAAAPRLRGRVVDEEGDGVDGAHVVVVPDGPAYAVVQATTTDVLGSFALQGVPGQQAFRLVAEQGEMLVVSAPLTMPSAGALENLVLTLARARLLRGHVSDEEGAPVAEATLTVEALPWPGRSAASGPDGAFEMARVPHDAPAVLVSARGFVSARVPLAPRGAEGPEALDVTLRRAPELKGTVLDPEGKPVAGATVLACEGKDGGRAASDEQGGFRLPASSEGCPVVAQHDEFAPSEPVVAQPGGRGLSLRLGPGGAIAGVVVDEGGAPVATFSVGVESFTPATGEHSFSIRSGPSRPFQDSSGAFTVDRLAPGSYVLTVTTEGKPVARSQSVDVGPGRTTSGVRIVMAAGGTVEGRVFDEEKHAAVAGARLSFDSLTSTQPDAGPHVLSDAEGNFRLENAPAGPFTLRVEHEGYRTRLVAGLRVASRQSLRQEVGLAPAEAPGLAFGGIGATLQQTREGLVFTDAFPNDPAYRAGVRAGDRLRRIDGDSVEGLSVADAIQRLRGAGGTTLAVTVEREGVPWPLDFVIVRAEIVR
ncbi:MAG TPA: carboxypeptidase regulatory-like domain-containing protein [Polyangiaceae bacterium]|nr:carboxypeptidase regulatory-like domain-containing protein [Polyangiaceae bacterium]